MRFGIAAAAIGSGLMALAAPSVAMVDRAPNAQERAALERALKANGFERWEEIELDDDGPYWEVDDARTANAQDGKFDVKLDPKTMKIVKRQRDD